MRSARPTWILAALGVAALALVLGAENMGAGFLNSLVLRLPGIDKALHFVQSAVVCGVVGVLLGRTRLSFGARVMLAAAAALALAGFDELQQSWSPDRNVELADVGAGVSGIAVAVAAIARDRQPRAAAALALVGFLAGGLFVYDTYYRLRDYNRGVLAEREGRADDALQHYLKAIDADVDNPEAYNAAAWSIAESANANFQQAVAYAEQSLRLRPRHADTLDTYGWALFRAGRAGDALIPLEQALAAKPDIYCIHYHLGMVYLALDRREEALRHLRRQIEWMPETREARLAADLLAGIDSEARRHQ